MIVWTTSVKMEDSVEMRPTDMLATVLEVICNRRKRLAYVLCTDCFLPASCLQNLKVLTTARLARSALSRSTSASFSLFWTFHQESPQCSPMFTLPGGPQFIDCRDKYETNLVAMWLWTSFNSISNVTLFCKPSIKKLPPQNGAECSLNRDGSPSCICPEGFSGVFCELAPHIGLLAAYQQVNMDSRPVHKNIFLEFPKYSGRFMLHFDI